MTVMPVEIVAAAARPPQERAGIAYPAILLIATLLLLPGIIGPPLLRDSHAINWVWADQVITELRSGNLLPRWLPESHGGLGSPVFYYYPPLAFYVAGLFGVAGLSTYAAIIATFGTAFALSGVTAWHWLKGHSSQPLLGALVFVAAPYHVLDFVRRGALAESCAIALIPLVAIGLRRIADGRGATFAALAYAALIMTHLPLALLASLMLIAPYGLALIARDRGTLVPIAIACACGVGLAAVYLVPALALDQYRDSALLYRMDHLTTPYWGAWNADWASASVINIYIVIGALALLAGTLFVQRRDFWSALALVLVLLTAGLIPGFWSLPLLEKVQFPFRALPIVEFAIITALARRQTLRLPLRPMLMACGVLSLIFLLPTPGARGDVAALRANHPDVPENLPRGVVRPGTRDDTLLTDLRAPDPLPAVPGMVVEPTFYFPAWSCGEPEPRTKLLMHPPDCTPRLVRTWEEHLGLLISVAAGLLMAATALLTRRTRQDKGATRDKVDRWRVDAPAWSRFHQNSQSRPPKV